MIKTILSVYLTNVKLIISWVTSTNVFSSDWKLKYDTSLSLEIKSLVTFIVNFVYSCERICFCTVCYVSWIKHNVDYIINWTTCFSESFNGENTHIKHIPNECPIASWIRFPLLFFRNTFSSFFSTYKTVKRRYSNKTTA